MVNTNGGKRDDRNLNGTDLDERKSDATSDEQLSDLEETGADSSSTDADLDFGPSPDGALDESDEIKDAGPM